MHTKYDSKTPEILLIEAIRDKDADTDEQSCAMQELLQRYQHSLSNFVRMSLPNDWVEDVIQDIWEGIIKEIRVEGVRKGFSNLLYTIARNTRADAVETLTIERKIEADIPLSNLRGKSAEENSDDLWGQKQILHNLLFKKSYLSDCQRVLWLLKEKLDIPSSIVARLTGKNISNVDVATHNAKKKIKRYFNGKEYYIDLATLETKDHLSHSHQQYTKIIVERFSNSIQPNFTPEELYPLALTVDDCRSCAVTLVFHQHLNVEYIGLLIRGQGNEWGNKKMQQHLELLEQLSGTTRAADGSLQITRDYCRKAALKYYRDHGTFPESDKEEQEYRLKYSAATWKWDLYNKAYDSPGEILVAVSTEKHNIILAPLFTVFFALSMKEQTGYFDSTRSDSDIDFIINPSSKHIHLHSSRNSNPVKTSLDRTYLNRDYPANFRNRFWKIDPATEAFFESLYRYHSESKPRPLTTI